MSKCMDGDSGYHAIGDLVVAQERSISLTLDLLNTLIKACGDRQIFILSPMVRFIIMPCCDHPAHMTNFGKPDYLSTILRDLGRLRSTIRNKLVGGQLIDSMELLCGDGYSMERAEAAARLGWQEDPVHPTKHSVAKMALHLIEKMGDY